MNASFTFLHHPVRCLLALVFILTSAVACAQNPASKDTDADDAELKTLRQQIDKLVGSRRCQNLVNCRVIGVGVRPCGGPVEYLAYSIWRTDSEALETKVAEYNFLQEEIDRKKQRLGPCEIIEKPAAACTNGQCVLVP